MKIGPLDTTPSATPVAGERKAAAAPTPASGGAEPSAKVDLSSAAQVGSANSEASFDKAKVDAVSSAIAKGTFKVNPEAIADKLISNAQERLGKTSS